MEERGSDLNKYQPSIQSNYNLYLFDDIYPKIKSYKKGFRNKSAINHNKLSFKTIKNNLKSRHSEIFLKNNNNSSQNQNVEILSLKSRNKLNIKINSINLSNNLKTNDSKLKLDTTKTTSIRSKLISSKRNSNLNFSKFNESAKSENKRYVQLKNNNRYSVINLKVDDFQKKNQSFKAQTLIDLTLQHFTNKLILEKISKNNCNNKSCSEKIKEKLIVFNRTFTSNKTAKRNNINNKEDNKNSFSNTQRNYSIKYSFLENTMNNILHGVKFVNIEKGEELYLKVLKKIDNNKNKMSFEDYKTIGYELTPEELYKIYQDKNQKELKEKYEKIKQDYLQENLQKTKAYKLLRYKRNKNYIPEYKIEFKNEDWKNKKYVSIYKFKPIKYPATIKKFKLNSKKRFINNNFNIKKLRKNNSENLSIPIKKFLDNKNKSNFYKNNVRKNEDIKQVLFNNAKNSKNNYKNKLFSENDYKKIYHEKNKDINNNLKVIEKNIIININNKNIENKNKVENENDKINENNINYNHNILNGHINDINHIDYINDNNIKDFKIAKTDSIFIQQCEDYEFEMVLTEHTNKDNIDIKDKRRNSLNYLTENENISNIKNEIVKITSNKIFDKKSKEKINIFSNSVNNSTSKELNFKNRTFKEKEEKKFNNNKLEQDNDKEKIINNKGNDNSLNKDEKRNRISSFEEYIIYKEKILNEQLNQKKFFDNIAQDDLEKNKIKSKRKMSRSQKTSIQGFNKIELNFISSKPNKYIKYKLIRSNRKYNSQIIDMQPKKDSLINNEKKVEKKLIKNNEISDEKVNELAERATKVIKRRMKRSATLDYINRKIIEIKDKKDTTNIDEELEKNFNQYKLFKDVNLESLEDIEFNKTLLLFKIREKIRYKILIGECDKSEMEEYNKFENKLNEYKSNFNLKNKKGIKQYALLLLLKFNEFIELFEIRDCQKMEENRINKFIDDLNYNLYINYPFMLNIKGKRCSSRNLNKNISNLSEIEK